MAALNLLAIAVHAIRPIEACASLDVSVVDLLFAREPRLLTPDKSRMFTILDQLQVMYKHKQMVAHLMPQPRPVF